MLSQKRKERYRKSNERKRDRERNGAGESSNVSKIGGNGKQVDCPSGGRNTGDSGPSTSRKRKDPPTPTSSQESGPSRKKPLGPGYLLEVGGGRIHVTKGDENQQLSDAEWQDLVKKLMDESMKETSECLKVDGQGRSNLSHFILCNDE